MRHIKVRIAETTRDGPVLKWTDDAGSDKQKRCNGKTKRARETERRAKEKEVNDRSASLTWADFWNRICDNHLADMSRKHWVKCNTMQVRLTEAAGRLGIGRLHCVDINAELLLEVESELRKLGNEPSTIKSNMDTLWSLLTWGQDYDLVPDIRRPRKRRGKQAKQMRKSKGRALTLDEIRLMREAIPDVIHSFESPEIFLHAMSAMELIGMRLGEVWNFCWEPIAGTHYPVRLHRTNPAVVFSDTQKSGIEQEVPLTQEAAEWLRFVPRVSQWICRNRGPRGEHKTYQRLGKVIAAAGQRANVIVKQFTKPSGDTKVKYASAHDFRRTFATRLHQDLNISELQVMTRHGDADVLLDFYGDVSTPVLIEKLNARNT